jgi:hypothetical protein
MRSRQDAESLSLVLVRISVFRTEGWSSVDPEKVDWSIWWFAGEGSRP